MLIHEEFLRCPNCGHSLFKEKKVVSIHKETFEKLDDIYVIEERITYKCANCGYILKEIIRDTY